MTKNVLSVSKFCHTNNVSIEFFSDSFLVKDLHTGLVLLKGPHKGGVYEWPSTTNNQSPQSIQAFTSSRISLKDWHHHLGHPSDQVLHKILSNANIYVPFSRHLNCSSCKSNKLHKLSFGVSSMSSTQPLELIYSDVWGPTKVLSFDGYSYYVIFIDHFSKYIWLFPIKHKSNVESIFIQFKAVVEKIFQRQIISFYSYNGGEFFKIKIFFSTEWNFSFSHFTSHT